MKKPPKWLIKTVCWIFGIWVLIFTVHNLFFSEEVRLAEKAKEIQEANKLSIAPVYRLYMDTLDADSMDIHKDIEYRQKPGTNEIYFFTTSECKKGIWSSSIVLNPNTMTAVMRQEYDGNLTLATVQFTPNTYGGFDLKFKYQDGRSASGIFNPVWFETQPKLTVGGIVTGIKNAISEIPLE